MLDKDLEKQTRPENNHDNEGPPRDPNLIEWWVHSREIALSRCSSNILPGMDQMIVKIP
jgi:hypothetical protein